MARICIVGDSSLARDLRTLVRTDPDLVLHDGKTFATTIVEIVVTDAAHDIELRTGTRVSPTELAVVAQLAHRCASFRVLADDDPDERTVYLLVADFLAADARVCNNIATAIYTALLQSLKIDHRSWWRRLLGHAAIIMLLAAPANAQLTSTSPSGGGGGGTVTQGTAAATTDAAAWPMKVVFGGAQIDPRDISDRVGRTLGQVTFSSPQAVTQSGAWAISFSTPQHIVCDSGCGSPPATADTSAFTFGTTSVSPIGAVVDDVATNTVAENSFGAPRMSTNRVLLVDGSGVTQPVSLASVPSHPVTNAGTFAVQVTSAPTTAVTNAGLSNLDVLLSTRTKPADQQHTIIDSSATLTVTGPLTDTQLRATPVPISGSISNTAFIANAGTNLNTSALALDATLTGRLPAGGSPANGESNTNTALSRIGAFNYTFNGTSWDRWTGAVTLASVPTHSIDSITTSIVPGTGATNLGKAEDAAAVSGDTGVSALLVRKDTNATLTSADGDYVQQARDNYGATFMRLDHPNRIRCVVPTSTATVITAVGGSCVAPGAGLSIYITDVMFSASATGIAADAFPTLKYGTGGTCGTGTTVFWGALTAATNFRTADNFHTPLKIPANNEVCWITSTAGSKFIVISGFIAP
jgi:hypothetical protein